MACLSGAFRRSAFAVALIGGVAGPATAVDFSIFTDPEDNYIDASAFLAKGGFIPVPAIITEPAVDGGLGIIGQFVGTPSAPGDQPARTMFGIARTGNESTAGGIMRSGSLRGGSLRYKVGLGAADITMPIFPFGLKQSVDYSNENLGGFANLRMRLGESNFWAGPRLVYRRTEVSLGGSESLGSTADRVRERINELLEPKHYVALGASLHYDTRNNPITPTEGINGSLRYDFYDGAFGSDADFGIGQGVIAGFAELADTWSLGVLNTYKWTSGDNPFFTSPSVDLRGVQSGRYAGDGAYSAELELRKQFAPRWAGVAFGGYGATQVTDSKLYESKSGIWTYGAGIRYRLARLVGLDVGLDIARGPEDTVFYIQFGHAWGRAMD